MKSLKPQIKLSVLMLALLGVTACGYSAGKSNGYYYSGNYYSKSNYEPPISKPADNYQSRSQQSQQQLHRLVHLEHTKLSCQVLVQPITISLM